MQEGDSGRPKYVGMVLILIFAEALDMYGLIVGLILTTRLRSTNARAREG